MKTKRIISILIIMILIFTQLSFITNNLNSYATSNIVIDETDHYMYYYDQLTDEGKEFYKALYQMYKSGMLKKGNVDYDLVENGHFTQEQVKTYISGDKTLLHAMGAARDAFYTEFPEIFYVDFSYLSLKPTYGADGKVHLYLGTGRSDNYYISGFKSEADVDAAQKIVDEKVNAILAKAKAVTVDKSKEENLQMNQVECVHDEIIKSTSYRYEIPRTDADKLANRNLYGCKPGNEDDIRTIYGVLCNNESVCEGYAKTAKVILDKLGIPCILVKGMMDDGITSELHMWNYFQIDGKWYALDCTADDPYEGIPTSVDIGSTQGYKGIDGFEKKNFIGLGSSHMDMYYRTMGIMSEANFEFSYPELERKSFGYEEVSSANGLTVEYSKGQDFVSNTDNGTTTAYGAYKISYKGMGYEKAKEQGYYIIARYFDKKTTDNVSEAEIVDGDLVSYNWGYMDPAVFAFIDTGSELVFTAPHIPYMQVGVTKVAPSGTGTEALTFRGTDADIIAKTDVLYNEGGVYKAPPYIAEANPPMTSKVYYEEGKVYHIEVKYKENLKVANGATEQGIVLTTTGGSTSIENSKVTNFKWTEGSNKISFDFVPSGMWADDTIAYYFNIKGLVGQESEKTPLAPTYVVAYKRECVAVMAMRGEWDVFAKPTIIANSDLSEKEWTTDDGTVIPNHLKDRLTLIATETLPAEEKDMNDMLAEKYSNDVIKSSTTYNITMTMCNRNVNMSGQKVNVALGFPEGYGPNSKNVTYKAYHFIRDSKDNIIGVEEIPCVITPYGIMMTCDSFSPFTIAAVETKPEDQTTDKTLILSDTIGGAIKGVQNSIVNVKQGETVELTVEADEGYVIESLTVCGETVDLSAKSDGVKEKAITLSYDDIKTENNIVSATFLPETVVAKAKEKGETIVAPALPKTVPARKVVLNATANVEKVQKGKEFEVAVKITDVDKIDEGIVAFAGTLEYDKNVLELVLENEAELVAYDDWKISSHEGTALKFVGDITGKTPIKADTSIFKVKFKVKEGESMTAKNTQIKIKDFTTSGGQGVILADDATVSIDIETPVEEKFEVKDTYQVIEKYIVNIDSNTKISDFKSHIDTNITPIVFTDADEKVLTDNDIVKTGTKVKAGEKIEYTLIVTGDIDRDGDMDVNDLAKLKLHLIDKVKLTDEIDLKAADATLNKVVNIDDLARMKLTIIGYYPPVKK